MELFSFLKIDLNLSIYNKTVKCHVTNKKTNRHLASVIYDTNKLYQDVLL